MATQSKTAAQLKSEVLKPSSRPYELIEYDPDKIFTGEINPDLINSNITTYEKNSEGTIIIDKNKDLTSQKMLISLNTTKISNVKFNQIIDIEFQDFPDPVDKSTAPLNLQINALQVKGATEAAKKAALEAKIDQLNSQIESLRNVADLAKIIVNEVPDSIAYGTALYSDESGIGSMLLSQHRRARGVINENGTFKVTLGNYDGKGKLIDGEETVTFDTYKPPGGPINNINAYALTDLEANQYLINNPDLEPYFNSPQTATIAALAALAAANQQVVEAEDALIAAKLLSDAAAADAKTVLDQAIATRTAAEQNQDLDLPTILYTWDAGGSLINAAKAHWRYINTSSKSELLTRFYLSDDEARTYLNNYPDLQAAFGTNLQLAKRHWNENGFDEGRTYSRGASLIHIWRSDVDEKGYVEIVKTNPWSVRYSSEYVNLSQSSRIGLDDNGILFLYDKDKIVWQSFN